MSGISKTHSVAMIGCGRWGRNILRDLVSLGCDVLVVDPSQEAREQALTMHAKSAYSSIEDLPQVEAAIIAVTTIHHVEVIDRLLDRNIPLFIEKPLCCEPSEAKRLAEEAAGRLFMMHKWRYHPGVEALAAIARTKELGKVLGVKTQRLGWGHFHEDVDCIWILAPHELTIALEILGEIPTPRCAVAEILDDVPCSLTAILGSEPWTSFEISTRSIQTARNISLHCERGEAVLDDPYADHLRIITGTTKPHVEKRAIATEYPLLRELRFFIQYLEGGAPPRSSAREGAQVIGTIQTLRDLAGIPERETVLRGS